MWRLLLILLQARKELNKKIKSMINNLPDKFEDLTGENLDVEGNKDK